jgi:hypothetical protein
VPVRAAAGLTVDQERDRHWPTARALATRARMSPLLSFLGNPDRFRNVCLSGGRPEVIWARSEWRY